MPAVLDQILHYVSFAFILAGSFFTVVGAIGLLRMPRLFVRMHAASVIDTAGVGLLCIGMILQAGLSLVSLKLFFIMALFFFTGPVITHALAQAVIQSGYTPKLVEDRRGRDPDAASPPRAPKAASDASTPTGPSSAPSPGDQAKAGG